MKRVEISLSIASSLPVLCHDGLGFNRYPDRRRLRLGDSGVSRDSHDCRRGTEDQVNIPLAASNNDLAIDVIDQLALSGVLSYSRTGIEKIL